MSSENQIENEWDSLTEEDEEDEEDYAPGTYKGDLKT